MIMTPTEEARLALAFVAQLKNLDTTTSAVNAAVATVKLLGYDHNWDNIGYPTSLLTNTTMPYSSADLWHGVAWHCYGGDVGAEGKLYSQLKSEFTRRGLETHMTECSGGGWQSSWSDILIGNQQSLFIGGANNMGQVGIDRGLSQHGVVTRSTVCVCLFVYF